MARTPSRENRGPATPDELLVRARRRGTTIRRRRRLLVSVVASSLLVVAVAGAVAASSAGSSPSRLHVAGSESQLGQSCPRSEFGPSLTSGAVFFNSALNLKAGQSGPIAPGIELKRGVPTSEFAVSRFAHGPVSLRPVTVLGQSSYLYPSSVDGRLSRIPFRFPLSGSGQEPPCSRYELTSNGASDAALIAFSTSLVALAPNGSAGANAASPPTTTPEGPRTSTTLPPAGTGPTTTTSTPSVATIKVYADCTSPSFEPSEIILTCADDNTVAENLHWSSWTSTAAVAVGTLVYNDCVPDCAQGTLHSIDNDQITLSAPVTGASGQVVWSQIQESPQPPGYATGPYNGGPQPLATRPV
jgi:hypothetical protein